MERIYKFIAVFIISIFMLFSKVYAADIAVIVNVSGPLVSSAESDIADIYLGEKRFQDGIKIVPLLFVEGEIKDTFLRKTVRMTPKEYKLYWTKKIFQEGIPIPKTAGPTDIVNTVKETEGGIGFLPRDTLKDLTGIKIIKVISK